MGVIKSDDTDVNPDGSTPPGDQIEVTSGNETHTGNWTIDTHFIA